MNESRNASKPQRPATRPANAARPAATQDGPGDLVAWQSGSGDSKRWHIVHVSSAGLAWALDLTDAKHLAKLVQDASERPNDASQVIGAHKGARTLPKAKLNRVTYAKKLKQLTIVDDAGKKHNVAYGDEGEQELIFDAVNNHLGGTAGEEDADAWSVIKVSLFALVVTIGLGALAVGLAANADPNYVAVGRRSGMKQLINDLCFKLGPVWMAAIFAAIAVAIAAPMVVRLVNRPKRYFLTFE